MRRAAYLAIIYLSILSLGGLVNALAAGQQRVGATGRSFMAIDFKELESHFCRESFCWFRRDRALEGKDVVTSCFISGKLRRQRNEPYGFMCDNGSVNVFTRRYIYVVVDPGKQPLYMRENNCGLLQCEFLIYGKVRFGEFTGLVPTPHIMIEGRVKGHSLQLHYMRRTGRRMSAGQIIGDVYRQFRTICMLVGCSGWR